MTDWRDMCRARDLELEEQAVVVRFEGGRSHRVQIAETTGAFELLAIVARRARIPDVENLAEMIWRRNRSTQLVSFKLDRRGRVVGTAWCPRVGITSDELQLVIRRLASESDRFEYLLTGRDLE